MAAYSRSCVLLSIVVFASLAYRTSACDGTGANEEIIEGICYSRHGDSSKADHKTWWQAKSDCESRDGWLAQMETAAEWEAVKDFITDTIYSGQWVWLGGKGNNRNNMKWGDKDSKVKDTLSSLQWDDRNYGDCLNVNPTRPGGKVLLRNSCGFAKPYICEYQPLPAAEAEAVVEEAEAAVAELIAAPIEEPTVWCERKEGFLNSNNLSNGKGGISFYFEEDGEKGCTDACENYEGGKCVSCDFWPHNNRCLLNEKREADRPTDYRISTTAVYNERC